MADHVCPCWIGYLLISPLRKLVENPDKMMGEYVSPGMTVLEIGPGLGFFSLPLARMVGGKGRVICVDLQPKMLSKLLRRAEKAGLGDRIVTSLCEKNDFGTADLKGTIDFALAMHVIHELPAAAAAFDQIHRAMRPGGRMLFGEPKFHVSESDFAENVRLAEAAGFRKTTDLAFRKTIAVLMEAS